MGKAGPRLLYNVSVTMLRGAERQLRDKAAENDDVRKQFEAKSKELEKIKKKLEEARNNVHAQHPLEVSTGAVAVT